MIKLLKSMARMAAPRAYEQFRRKYKADARVTRTIVRRQGLAVAAGPFAGMRYILESHGSRLMPKLLGSYECELHAVVAEIVARRPRVVVDVGCAEGYYAVGLATTLPDAFVYAYDIDVASRQLCARLASINDVSDRVMLRSRCDCEELLRLPLDGAVVICDCEGYEAELLCPDRVPSLRSALLLVEMHEMLVPGVTELLMGRFRSSHGITIIEPRGRDPRLYGSLRGLRPSMKAIALYERDLHPEPQQQWAYMQPLSEMAERHADHLPRHPYLQS